MGFLTWILFGCSFSSEVFKRPIVKERIHDKRTMFASVEPDTIGTIVLEVGTSFRLDVSVFPILLLFPEIDDVKAVVYATNGSQRFVLTTPTNVFGFYFRTSDAASYINFSAVGHRARFEYFAAKQDSSWTCPEYFVTSAPIIRWTAGNDRIGNFTMRTGQDVCFFHVSDAYTNVVGSYNLDNDLLHLHYHYSTGDGYYTGTSSRVTARSHEFTAFRWYSAVQSQLSSKTAFQIDLDSPESTLPYRTVVASDTSNAFVVIREGISKATRTRSRSPSPSRSQTKSQSPSPSPTHQNAIITDDASGTVDIPEGGTLRMSIASYPLFVVIPDLQGISGTVRLLNGTVTKTFLPSSKIFAIYFKDSAARGFIDLTATYDKTVTYYVIKYPTQWNCTRFWVSTSPVAIWGAGKTTGNFTVGANQDYCFLHVSDKSTDVWLSYNMQYGYEAVNYQYGTGSAQGVTGAGTVRAISATGYSAFQWKTEPNLNVSLDTFFVLEVSSPDSTLPHREGSGTQGKTTVVENGVFGSVQGRKDDEFDVLEIPRPQKV